MWRILSSAPELAEERFETEELAVARAWELTPPGAMRPDVIDVDAAHPPAADDHVAVYVDKDGVIRQRDPINPPGGGPHFPPMRVSSGEVIARPRTRREKVVGHHIHITFDKTVSQEDDETYRQLVQQLRDAAANRSKA